MRHIGAALVLALALGGFTRSAAQPATNTAPISKPAANGDLGPGLDSTAVDPSVKACQNFYRHACGGFIAHTPVNDGAPHVALADRRFQANLKLTMTDIFQPQAGGNPDMQRLATFQRSCLATMAGDESADLAVIDRWLKRIDAVQTRAQLAPLMRELAEIGVAAFVTYDGRPDPGDAARYRGELHNSRLTGKQPMIERALVISGAPPEAAARDSEAVAKLLAKLAEPAVWRYDFPLSQHPMKAGDLTALAPSFDWAGYFAAVGIDPGQTINVTSPDYLRAVEAALREEQLTTLKAYLRWSFLLSLRGELPRHFDSAFAELSPALRPNPDSTQRCRDATTRALGVEFSRELARRALDRESRDQALSLSQSIRAVFVRSLAATPWLSPAGRRAVADKVEATDLKIGYPDVWPSTGAFQIRPDAFLENVLAARRFEQSREWRRAGEQRSRRDWEFKVDPWVGEGMAAARLALPNGFPDAFTNSLLMTAAFLLPPRYDAEAPVEVNYGVFGAVVGHELIHVAQNYEFDAEGRLKAIWDEVDAASAQAARQCVVDQAAAHALSQGLKLDAKRQVDENTADLGGVRLAYTALSQKLGPKLNQQQASGMMPAKRFFYAYAQSYCSAETASYREQAAATNSHGLPEFRVNGVLANLPGFASAFGCAADAPMARPAEQQCKVW